MGDEDDPALQQKGEQHHAEAMDALRKSADGGQFFLVASDAEGVCQAFSGGTGNQLDFLALMGAVRLALARMTEQARGD